MRICAELRTLTSSMSLLTCADGTQFVLKADPAQIATLFDQADNDCSSETLGRPLYSALAAHDSFKDLPSTSVSPVNGTPELVSSDSPIIVCGDARLASSLAGALKAQGVECSCSSHSPRECSYQVFRGGLLIVCRSQQSKALFSDELSAINKLNVSWIPVDYSGTSLLIGPVILDGTGATYSDRLVREQANSTHLDIFMASMQPALRGSFLDAIVANTDLIAKSAKLIADIHNSGRIDKEQSSSLDTVWEISPNADLVVHPVLPINFVNPPQEAQVIHSPTFTVDSAYGIIKGLTRVKHSQFMPSALRTTQARTTNLDKVTGYVNTVFCQGSSIIPASLPLEDQGKLEEQNFYAAIGESVERYCSNLIDLKPVQYASFCELKKRGFPVLDPKELVLFSGYQYRQKGFPFQPVSPDLRIGWIEGRYLDDDSPVFVPASLVYVNWHTRQNRLEPRINFPAFAGIASGSTTEQAILSGLSEVIERHATMVWWLNAQPLPHIKLTADQLGLFEGSQEPLRPALIHLDNTFNIPVAAGVVHNDISQLVHVGFSCRSTLNEAALKAWSEALTLQEGSYDLKDPNGIHWAAIRDGLLPGRSFKDWRKDRHYLDDFRPDLKDVDDLLVQQEVFLDPRAVEHVSPMLDLPATRDAATITDLPDTSLSTYLDNVCKRGNRVITVDITSPDVASCGLKVIRTIVPGTVGNTPAAFPYLGNDVVVNEAVTLGWRKTPLDVEHINNFPMPHA